MLKTKNKDLDYGKLNILVRSVCGLAFPISQVYTQLVRF